jgi:hypothetical protein
MNTAFCTSCGREIASDDRFCPGCGIAQPAPDATGTAAEAQALAPIGQYPAVEPVATAPEPEPVVAAPEPEPVAAAAEPAAESTRVSSTSAGFGWASPSTPGEFNFTSRTNIDLAGRPLELWVPVALFAAAGAYLLQLTLRALPDTFRLFNIDFLPKSYVFALVLVLLLVIALGVGLLGIAALLYRGDRIGRGIAYLAVAALAGIAIFGEGTTTGEVLTMVGGFAAAAILGLAPAVKEIFDAGRQRDQPTSIIVARVALATWLVLLAVGAVIDFCLESVSGKFIFYGIILAALAVGGFLIFTRLGLADPRARIIVTLGAAAALIFLLLGLHNSATAFLVGLTVAIPVCLWLPADARAFYGDQPLVTVRQPV